MNDLKKIKQGEIFPLRGGSHIEFNPINLEWGRNPYEVWDDKDGRPMLRGEYSLESASVIAEKEREELAAIQP